MIITPKTVYLEMTYDEVQCLFWILCLGKNEAYTERQKAYKEELENALAGAFNYIGVASLGMEEFKLPESATPEGPATPIGMKPKNKKEKK